MADGQHTLPAPLADERVNLVRSLHQGGIAFYVVGQIIIYSALFEYPLGVVLANVCRALFMLAAVYKIVWDLARASARLRILFAGILVLSLAPIVSSGEKMLLLTSVFVLSCYRTDYLRTCRTILITLLLGCTAVFIFGFLGVLESTTYDSVNSLTGESQTRRAFGFGYMNYIGALFVSICLAHLIERNKRFGIRDALAWCVAAIFLYFVVGTKTSAFLLIIMLGLVMLLRLSERYSWQRTMTRVLVLMTAVAALAGIVLPLVFSVDSPLLVSINEVIGGRLSYARVCFESYPLTLFGNSVPFVTVNEALATGALVLTLDNAYAHLLVCYGVVSLLAVLGAYGALIVLSVRRCDWITLVLVTIMAISGSFEGYLFAFPGCMVLSRLLAWPDDAHGGVGD